MATRVGEVDRKHRTRNLLVARKLENLLAGLFERPRMVSDTLAGVPVVGGLFIVSQPHSAMLPVRGVMCARARPPRCAGLGAQLAADLGRHRKAGERRQQSASTAFMESELGRQVAVDFEFQCKPALGEPLRHIGLR